MSARSWSNSAMIGLGTGRAEKLDVGFLVPSAQAPSSVGFDGLPLGRFVDEPQQVVRDAFHRRDDDGQGCRGAGRR